MNRTANGKKYLKFIIAIIAIIAAVAQITILIKNNRAKWKCISNCYMDDFNADGKQEMLINYCTHKNSSAMKLVEVESGRTLWKSKSKQKSIINKLNVEIFDSLFLMNYIYKDNDDTSKKSIKSGIEAFNCITGKKVWELPFDDSEKSSGVVFLQLNNNLFVVRRNSQSNIRTIYSINPKKGTIDWQTDIPGTSLVKPIILDKKHLLFSNFFTYHILNTQTKQCENLSETYEINHLFQLGDNKNLFLINDSLLYSYDSSFSQITSENLPISFEWNMLSLVAVYKDNLITINQKSMPDHRYALHINSNPLTSDGTKKTYAFAQEIKQIESSFYNQRNNFIPEQSAFYNISTRFVPLVLNAEDEHIYKPKKLVVFDLDSMEIFAQSNSLKELEIKDIVYNNGFYALNITCPINDKFVNSIALIDGKTGKFVKSAEFTSNKRNMNIYWSHEHTIFSGNYIFGSDIEGVWCLNFPELDLIYSSSNNWKVNNNTEQMKKLLNL